MAFWAFLGQLSQMDLSQLQAISGSSAGAVLAFFWIMFDGSVPEILDFALKVQIATLMKPNIKNFLNNFGLVPMNKLRKALVNVVYKKFKLRELTFAELWRRRPVALYVSAFCTERGQTIYFSHETHPGESVIDVVCASIAVPFLFSTVKIGEWRYIDGGFQEAVPGLPFLTKPLEEVVCVRIGPPAPSASSSSIGSHVGHLLTGILRQRHTYNYPSYVIDAENINIFDFSADGLEIFVHGQKSRKLINEAYYPLGLHGPARGEEDHGQGDGDSQVVHVHAEAGLHPGEARADP